MPNGYCEMENMLKKKKRKKERKKNKNTWMLDNFISCITDTPAHKYYAL
jgi:hypothetical protein